MAYDNEEIIEKHGCPIKKGTDCPGYDKKLHEYKQTVEWAAERGLTPYFRYAKPHEHCPNKETCSIYLNRKQKAR